MNQDQLENFEKAVEEDEYAELDLGDGYTLITDHEFDGTFNPYIAPPDGLESASAEEAVERLQESDVMVVTGMEVDEANGVYRPYGYIDE